MEKKRRKLFISYLCRNTRDEYDAVNSFLAENPTKDFFEIVEMLKLAKKSNRVSNKLAKCILQ